MHYPYTTQMQLFFMDKVEFRAINHFFPTTPVWQFPDWLKDLCSNHSFYLQLSTLKMISEFVPDLSQAVNVWLGKILKQLKLYDNNLKSPCK